MQLNLPFLKKALSGPFEVVPIYLGLLPEEEHSQLADILELHFDRDDALFVFCSNLCSWSGNSQFTEENKKPKDYEIFEHVEKLDKECMKAIEKQHLKEFEEYVDETQIKLNGKLALSLMLKVR